MSTVYFLAAYVHSSIELQGWKSSDFPLYEVKMFHTRGLESEEL